MKSYSKLQNYLSLFMFITINILFYFKYLSKISIACGAITSVLYILFIIFLFKYKPTFGRKLVNVGIITFIIATSSLLFFIPKEIFTADRWIIIDLFWDSVSNGLYPYAEKTSIGNYPGAMPFYFLLCYPFYCIREIGFITVISIALLAFHFKRKSVQSYSLSFILSISSLCIYWEIFSRSTILINAVLFTLFLFYLERFRTFSTRQLILERCHRRIAVLYSQRVRAAAHRMGIVSTLSRKNTSEENIPVGLCFPIVLRDYFRSFHLAISR